MAFDWETAAAGIGTAASVIREFIGGSIKADILRERMGIVADRLDLAKDQILYQGQMMSRQETRIAELLSDLDKTRADNRTLNLQVSALQLRIPVETFVEQKGLFFKRSGDGTWSDNAYCPNCKSALIRAGRGLSCANKNCGWADPFQGAGKMVSALSALRAHDAATVGHADTEYDPLKEP